MNPLLLKYFVLKPGGGDRYAEASRAAMRAYAAHVESTNRDLAQDLREWADREKLRARREDHWPEA